MRTPPASLDLICNSLDCQQYPAFLKQSVDAIRQSQMRAGQVSEVLDHQQVLHVGGEHFVEGLRVQVRDHLIVCAYLWVF